MHAKFEGRREDARFLTGAGFYSDDRPEPGAAFAAFVRSPLSHARIRRIDTAAARAMAGVLGIVTAADLDAAGYGPLPCLTQIPGKDGALPASTPRPALAAECVRYVGEPVAMLVAESEAAAMEAAESVILELDGLPSVADLRAASGPEAPQIWPHIPGNCAATYMAGDEAATARAMAAAPHRVRISRRVSRVVAGGMEPRAVTARYDGGSGRWQLFAGSQGVRRLHDTLAQYILKTPADRLQVSTGDVGGGFGPASEVYPEHVALLHAARMLGRPVRWRASRSEVFLSELHARDSVYDAELALDSEGRVLALRVEALQAIGAYLSSYALVVQRSCIECISSMYAVPAIHVVSRSILTNTMPTGPFRGAGRPEAAYATESLMDEAARRLGIDALELRRRNLVTSFPYRTAQGPTYDNGDFHGLLAKAERLADRGGFPARRAASQARGRLRGMGISCFVETAGGVPVEAARLSVASDGTVSVFAPTQSSGQGHETVFPLVAAERLGISADQVMLVTGDSDTVPGGPGSGSYGSRSLAMFGSAMALAADGLIENGKVLAARMLEARPDDITYQGGRFAARAGGRSCSLAELADWAADPRHDAQPLGAQAQFAAPSPTFPNGCHICEVEIDPETGAIDIVRYTAVDDCGELASPTIVHGQIQGGVAQGIGQALVERCVYDGEGQLVTGSFLDYAMPRAGDLPAITVADHPTATRLNPLGMKGAGEAGTTGALTAASNAVADALATRGVSTIEMPATPDRIWHALNGCASMPPQAPGE